MNRTLLDYIRAKCLAKSGLDTEALDIARRRGFDGEAIKALQAKAAVDGMTTSNTPAPIGFSPVLAALEDLRFNGAFDAMLSTMLPLPAYERVAISSNRGLLGSTVAEGAPTPAVAMVFSSQTVVPKRASAQTVLTSELLRTISPTTNDLLQRIFSEAAAAAVDAIMFPVLTNGISAISSESDPTVDLPALVQAIALGATSKLFLFASAKNLAAMALWRSNGVLAFPNVDIPLGGDHQGIIFQASDALTDSVVLVDGTQLAGSNTDLSVKSTEQGDVQMLTNPTNNSATATATALVGMFLTSSVNIKIDRRFVCERLRSTSVAVVSGADYSAVGSP